MDMTKSKEFYVTEGQEIRTEEIKAGKRIGIDYAGEAADYLSIRISITYEPTFYFGPSGSGKSRQLYQEMVERAGKEPDRNFFIIVPDQFTMETQKDLVVLSPRGGILNIDVLSFGRLSYRILEEVGRKETPILDDTGKSLVLQKVAAGLVEELPVLGSLLHKQGYIHEVKSAVSEFMQYGISTQMCLLSRSMPKREEPFP